MGDGSLISLREKEKGSVVTKEKRNIEEGFNSRIGNLSESKAASLEIIGMCDWGKETHHFPRAKMIRAGRQDGSSSFGNKGLDGQGYGSKGTNFNLHNFRYSSLAIFVLVINCLIIVKKVNMHRK